MSRDKSEGVLQNRGSHKGEDNTKGSKGSERVGSIEHVGSHGKHGVRFSMPKEVPDHSCVRGTEKE